MNNAMRMMAVNRARGNGGESRMNAGYGYDGEMRYEAASRYDGGNMGYESRRRYARMDPEQEEREYRQNYIDQRCTDGIDEGSLQVAGKLHPLEDVHIVVPGPIGGDQKALA